MGAWGTGPFDNDAAADWCGELDDADDEDRIRLIRRTLAGVAETVDDVDGAAAVAAAAVVASQMGVTEWLDSDYAPRFLADGGRIELVPGLAELAVRALDRLMADSEWRILWEDSGGGGGMFWVVDQLREALSR